MAAACIKPSSVSTFILVALVYLALQTPTPILVQGLNITSLLSSFHDLSEFTNLLSSTASVASDLAQRSSLTLLVVPNSYLSTHDDLDHHRHSPNSLADILRYHVLLEFMTWSDLHSVPPSGKLVTTLFQTTGRATGNFGSINITHDPSTGVVSIRSPASDYPSNATVLSLIKILPYNVSIFAVNSILIPFGFDIMASETRPTLNLNITKALIDGHNFNVAASMLSASGVVQEFEADEGGAGITLFVPTDSAFADLPPTVSLQSLPADKKAVVLKVHVLHSYYPLGSLESIVNPVQPTLATEAMGAGSFTLNISRVNGSVAIDTGIVQASVTQTVFDQNPVAIFGVSKVLLPGEIFGKNSVSPTKSGTPVGSDSPPPEMSISPESSPEQDGPGSHLSTPPGLEMRSVADVHGSRAFSFALLCVGYYLVV